MKIAIDAMGGDHAPGEIVRGALAGAEQFGLVPVLVGPPEALAREIRASGRDPGAVEIVAAHEVISNDESPIQALKRKPGASLAVALRLLKEGSVEAMVSAGNTGALMAGALLSLGRLPGVQRPALGAVIPSLTGRGTLLIDVGANVDPRPEQLQQYAVIGRLYAEQVLGRSEPKIGLLNIGTEPGKGNELAKATHALLAESPALNFIGNVEARNLLAGEADVVIMDGFVGNVVLKLTEGFGMGLFGLLRQELQGDFRSRLGAWLAKPSLRRVLGRLDYAEYGGAPLFGLQGTVIKCHGSSHAKAITSGLRVARDFVENRVLERITASLASGGELE